MNQHDKTTTTPTISITSTDPSWSNQITTITIYTQHQPKKITLDKAHTKNRLQHSIYLAPHIQSTLAQAYFTQVSTLHHNPYYIQWKPINHYLLQPLRQQIALAIHQHLPITYLCHVTQYKKQSTTSSYTNNRKCRRKLNPSTAKENLTHSRTIQWFQYGWWHLYMNCNAVPVEGLLKSKSQKRRKMGFKTILEGGFD